MVDIVDRIIGWSYGIMVLGDHIEGALHISDEDVAVLHLNSELLLECLVHVDRGFDVRKTALIAPVGVEGDGDALSYGVVTFQRAGSTALSRSCTHLMMRLAVRPGCVWQGLRDGASRCVWGARCRRSEGKR